MPKIVMQTDFTDLNLVNRGKVRDIYDLGEHLLIVTTDRISAFDVIMDQGIPNKGKVLTQISRFWFEQMTDIIPNHIVAMEVGDFPASTHKYREQLEGRSMLVKKAKPLPVECIVRGYVAGSGWKDYKKTGAICGIELPAGTAGERPAPRADLHPLDQGRTRRARREHLLRKNRGAVRRGARHPGPRHHHRHLQPRSADWPTPRGSSSPTPSSSSASSRIGCCGSTRR